MGHAKGQRTTKRNKPKPTQRERNKDGDASAKTDALIKEAQEANEHVADPSERERVIPSRPC